MSDGIVLFVWSVCVFFTSFILNSQSDRNIDELWPGNSNLSIYVSVYSIPSSPMFALTVDTFN